MLRPRFTRRDPAVAAPRLEALEPRTLMAVHPPVAVLSDTNLVYVPKAIVTVATGGTIVAARTNATAKYGTLFVGRYAADGTTVWTVDTKITKVGSDVRAVLAPDGGVEVLGTFAGRFDFDPGAGVTTLRARGIQTFLLKLDASGAFVSAQVLPFGNAMEFDAGGNLIIAGSFSRRATITLPGGATTLTGGKQAFAMTSMDAGGNFLWATTFGNPAGTQDVGSIAIDPQGKIYATGAFSGRLDLDPSGAENIVTAGRGFDAYVSRFDSTTGQLEWIERLEGSGNSFGNDIAVNAAGDVVFVGTFTRTADLDPTALGVFDVTNRGFHKSGGGDIFGDIFSFGGSSAAASDLNHRKSRQFTNNFVVRLNSDGSFVRADSISSKIAAPVEYVAIDDTGNAYLTGPMFSAMIIGAPGTPDPTPLARAQSDGNIFAIKYAPDGTLAWSTILGGPKDVRTSAIELDALGNLQIVGHFKKTSPDFDPGAVADILQAPVNGVFLWKLDPATGAFIDVTRI